MKVKVNISFYDPMIETSFQIGSILDVENNERMNSFIECGYFELLEQPSVIKEVKEESTKTKKIKKAGDK